MRHGFYAFGNDLAVKGLCQPNHAFQNSQVVRVFQHVAHKALVNFELRHRQPLEVSERRVAGAKVVQRKAQAQLLALLDHVRGRANVFQRAGFQHLKLQQCRVDTGVVGQDGFQPGHKIVLLHLACAHVHAHWQVQPHGLPGLQLGQRGVHHPFTYLHHQHVVFNGGQKFNRWHQAALGVLPANQGLCPHHLPAAHVDFGLVIQHQLALFEGLANAVLALARAAQVAVLLGVKGVVAVFAGQFGLVHGLVSLALQLVSINLFGLREIRHAQAGRHLHLPLGQRHRRVRGIQQPLQQRRTGFALRQVHHHRHKFVTPQARQRVAFTQDLLHALGQRHQQLVAHFVAMGVVDELEAVQVKVHHSQLQATPLGVVHGLVQAVGQQHAVGQAGQGIKMRHVFKLLLMGFERRDV